MYGVFTLLFKTGRLETSLLAEVFVRIEIYGLVWGWPYGVHTKVRHHTQ